MVDAVTANFPKVVVLLNVGAMIDTSWFANNDAISSAILLWQGGMEGGLAAADILTGDANPSGKLVDTCARTFEDYPSSADFHESEDYAKYTEDIYVGYRYFETVSGKKDCVVYPFGYGLSYTTFEYSNLIIAEGREFKAGDIVKISVDVTNTGNRAGKESVLLFINDDVASIVPDARRLRDFEKIELQPGETKTVCFEIAAEELAFAKNDAKWYLEKGSYTVQCGQLLEKLICLENASLGEHI
jgi:beta-glucosidase